MKKTFVLTVVMLVVIGLLVGTASAQEKASAAEHKKRIVFGYDFIGGTYYYPDGKLTWTPTASTAETDQGEEKMGLRQFSIRYGILQPLIPVSPNLFVGLEGGIGLPQAWSTSWDIDYYEMATVPSSGSQEGRETGPDLDVVEPDIKTKSSTKEYRVSVNPLVAKLIYENPNGLTLDAGLGAYLVYIGIKETTETEYHASWLAANPAVKDHKETRELCLTQVKPGIEGSIGYEFNPAGPVSFSIEGILMYIAKVRALTTYEDAYTGYTFTAGTPTFKHDDYKEGYEVGGLCYGLGCNIAWIF